MPSTDSEINDKLTYYENLVSTLEAKNKDLESKVSHNSQDKTYYEKLIADDDNYAKSLLERIIKMLIDHI